MKLFSTLALLFSVLYANDGAEQLLILPIFAWLVVIIVTWVMGKQKKLVVFRDVKDVGISFGVMCAAFIVLVLFMWVISDNGNAFVKWIVFIVSAIGFFIFLMYSLQMANEDNESDKLKTTLAALTKYPLSIFWFMTFINSVNPSGKTHVERASNRESSILWLAFFSFVIYAVMRDKPFEDKKEDDEEQLQQ